MKIEYLEARITAVGSLQARWQGLVLTVVFAPSSRVYKCLSPFQTCSYSSIPFICNGTILVSPVVHYVPLEALPHLTSSYLTDEGLKSHHISGLSEELTPASSSTVPSGTTTTEQAAPQQAGIILSVCHLSHILGEKPRLCDVKVEILKAVSSLKHRCPLQESRGSGGVTEYLKSWIGGGSGNADTAPHPDQKTTHTQDLKDGSTAAVHTAPQSSAGIPHQLEYQTFYSLAFLLP